MGRISVQACNCTVLKLCQVTWIPVKISGEFSEGRVPELSPALIERGLSLFRHVGFTGEIIGQPYGISVCNKSHLAVQVNQGQRLGRLRQDVDQAEVFTVRVPRRTRTPTLTSAWRSGLTTNPAIASGRRKVCLEEEENLYNCTARKTQTRTLEKQLIEIQTPDRRGFEHPETAPCWETGHVLRNLKGAHMRSGHKVSTNAL